MGKKIFMLLLLIPFYTISPQNNSSIILSEIMFHPKSGNNEFIELYNTGNDSIEISNYKIKYYSSRYDIIIDAGFGTVIPPKSFAVIFEGDYDIPGGLYNKLVPDSSLILKISDNAFGSSGMANSSDRPVLLLNGNDEVIDSCFYSANNPSGISDEKIILSRNSSSSNWTNCKTKNGTPGFRNSVTPYNLDLEADSLIINPSQIILGKTVKVSAKISNKGLLNAGKFSVVFYDNLNKDSVLNNYEEINSYSYGELNAGDSIYINFLYTPAKEGNRNITLKINMDNDENDYNNLLNSKLYVYLPEHNYNDVVVNEIMYAPVDDEPEWIELHNNTSKIINLKNWSISDNTLYKSFIKDDFFIEPDSFVVITKDTSIVNFHKINHLYICKDMRAFNNSGDAVVIKDSLGMLLDSVEYKPAWGGRNGKSLERIDVSAASNDSANWSSSIAQGNSTPGFQNSVTPLDFNLNADSLIVSTKNILLGKSVILKVKIINNGKNNSGPFNIDFYDDLNFDSSFSNNEKVDEIEYQNINKKDTLFAEFKYSPHIQGKHIIYAMINYQRDENLNDNYAKASFTVFKQNYFYNDLVLNEIMYAPVSGEPEWIELYNKSGRRVNIKNWTVSDNSTSSIIYNSNFIFEPDSYLVVSSDSVIKDFHKISNFIVCRKLPSLNNTGDPVVIKDSLGIVIDSIYYSPKWGGKNGKSLERVDINLPTNDSTNWHASKSKNNSTPGKINSVSKKDYDLSITGLKILPSKPFFGDDIKFTITIKNLGKKSANYSYTLFEDTNVDSLPDEELFSSNQFNLLPDDSATYNVNYILRNISSEKFIIAKIYCPSDEDTTNNIFYKTINPDYKPSTVLISEVMMNPSGDEPEWIELYNTSKDTVNIGDWTVNDVLTIPFIAKLQSNILILPQSYIILSSDSLIFNYHNNIPSPVLVMKLPVLNNTEDGVVIKDQNNAIIDSMFYNKDYNLSKGYSLERKSFLESSTQIDNWGLSKDAEHSTPGRINSIARKEYDLSVSKIILSPSLPVSGDDVSPSLKVINTGEKVASGYEVDFYYSSEKDSSNFILLDEVSGEIIKPEDSIIINSSIKIKNIRNDDYILCEIKYPEDEDNSNNKIIDTVSIGYYRGSIKINEIMYNPENNEPEWFELVNTSKNPINLKNWEVSDLLPDISTRSITTKDEYLTPGEYLVVSKNDSLVKYFPKCKSQVLKVNFGTLGNQSDGIIIYDSHKFTIDSVLYNNNWGGNDGRSLERVSLSLPSNDSINWKTSLSKNKATPGYENSVINLPSYSRNTLVINEIMYEPADGNSEYIELMNISDSAVNLGGWKIEDNSGDQLDIEEANYYLPANSYFVVAPDSSIIQEFSLDKDKYFNITGSQWITLSNQGSLLLLKDAKCNLIDSVYYWPAWHNKNIISAKGISLEKINPYLNGNISTDWNSSVNTLGGTPCRQNSIYTIVKNNTAKISISPNPFSPDNDGFEDYTVISYRLTTNVAQIRIRIFNSRGYLVRTLADNKPSASKGQIIFDGMDDNGNPLRMGIYIILLEAVNGNSVKVESLKAALVIARKLN